MSQLLSFARSTRLALALTGTVVVMLVVAATSTAPAHGASIASAVFIQSGETLPANIITSEDAASYREEIDAYLDAWIARLVSGDPQELSSARDALTTVAVRPDANRAFRQVYAEQLGRKLAAALRGKDVTTRLNGAIVTQKVARVAESAGLADLAASLVGDESAAVSLWGIKAVGPVLPGLVQRNPQQGRPVVVDAVVEAVKRFPQNGPLAEEAYQSLTDWITGSNRPPANIVRQGVGLMVPAVHELLALRLGQYTAQGHIPSEPLAEQRALVFISYPLVWPEQNPDQKAQTVRLLRDMMLQATEAARTAQGEARNDVVTLAARIGSAFVAIGNSSGNTAGAQALVQAATAVSRQPNRAAQTELTRTVNVLVDAIATAYPNLPPPETVTMQVPPDEPEANAEAPTTDESE